MITKYLLKTLASKIYCDTLKNKHKTRCLHLAYTIVGFTHYYVTIEERYDKRNKKPSLPPLLL